MHEMKYGLGLINDGKAQEPFKEYVECRKHIKEQISLRRRIIRGMLKVELIKEIEKVKSMMLKQMRMRNYQSKKKRTMVMIIWNG
jgi:hypothetical protein